MSPELLPVLLRIPDEGQDSHEPDDDRGIGERSDLRPQGRNLGFESASRDPCERVRVELRALSGEAVDVELPATDPIRGDGRAHRAVARGGRRRENQRPGEQPAHHRCRHYVAVTCLPMLGSLPSRAK